MVRSESILFKGGVVLLVIGFIFVVSQWSSVCRVLLSSIFVSEKPNCVFIFCFISEFEGKLKASFTSELSSVSHELQKVVCISRNVFSGNFFFSQFNVIVV